MNLCAQECRCPQRLEAPNPLELKSQGTVRLQRWVGLEEQCVLLTMAPLSSPQTMSLETSVYVGIYITIYIWNPEDNLQRLVLSFHHVDPRDWASVFRFGVKCTGLYLIGSKVNFCWVLILEHRDPLSASEMPVTCVPPHTTFRDGAQDTVHELGECSTNGLHL